MSVHVAFILPVLLILRAYAYMYTTGRLGHRILNFNTFLGVPVVHKDYVPYRLENFFINFFSAASMTCAVGIMYIISIVIQNPYIGEIIHYAAILSFLNLLPCWSDGGNMLEDCLMSISTTVYSIFVAAVYVGFVILFHGHNDGSLVIMFYIVSALLYIKYGQATEKKTAKREMTTGESFFCLGIYSVLLYINFYIYNLVNQFGEDHWFLNLLPSIGI